MDCKYKKKYKTYIRKLKINRQKPDLFTKLLKSGFNLHPLTAVMIILMIANDKKK